MCAGLRLLYHQKCNDYYQHQNDERLHDGLHHRGSLNYEIVSIRSGLRPFNLHRHDPEMLARPDRIEVDRLLTRSGFVRRPRSYRQ